MAKPGWYQEPASARQRYWDGHGWSDHEPDAPRARLRAVAPDEDVATDGWGRPIAVIVGTAVVFGGLGFAVLKLGDETDDPPLSPTTVSSQSAPAGAAAPAGSAARDGQLEFVVTSLDSSKAASAVPRRIAVGKFVNVHVRVINNGADPQVFAAADQKLHAGGQEFPADPDASLGDGYADVEVHPGTSIEAVVSFDVPDSIGSVQTIELHDTVSSDGARISLR